MEVTKEGMNNGDDREKKITPRKVLIYEKEGRNAAAGKAKPL